MKKRINWWKLIVLLSFIFLLTGIGFAVGSFKVFILLYFGIGFILVGAIGLLIYYILIGSQIYKEDITKIKKKVSIRHDDDEYFDK